jgi:hypothetical protein
MLTTSARCFYPLEITRLSVIISMLASLLLRRQTCSRYLDHSGTIQKKPETQDMRHNSGEI